MRGLRRFIGGLGLAVLAMGFYAFAEGMVSYFNGFAFRVASVAETLASLTGSAMALGRVGDWSTFYVFSVLGIVLAWWGLKQLPPKPKFRRP